MISSKVIFSVVIPCFNVEDTLSKSIDSVLNQDFLNFEIVAVNDGSTDNTVAILKSYEKKNKIKFITQTNKGLGAARNTGIKNSKGEYICLLDADDLWVSNKLSLINKIINKNKPSLISNDEIILESKKLIYLKNNPPKNLSNLLIAGNTLSPSGMTIKRDLFNKIGFFSEDKNYLGVEDWDLWVRAIDFGEKIAYISEPLGIYRRDIQNMSKSLDFNQRIINMFKIKSHFFQSKGVISIADMNNWETLLLLNNFLKNPNRKNLSSFYKYLKKRNFRYLFSFSLVKILLRLVFRKIERLVLTLYKYRRLKCIARELL